MKTASRVPGQPQRTRGRVALVLLLLLPLAHAAPAVRCADEPLRPASCPNLSPDARHADAWHLARETFPRPERGGVDCAIEEGLVEPGRRDLVRLTTVAQNAGPSALVLGDPAARPDWYEWSPCHGHWHFRDFAHYRIWTLEGHAQWRALRGAAPEAPASQLLAEHPALAAHLRAGHKQGFCVIDGQPMHPRAGYPAFSSCRWQGISPGWQDGYASSLDGQWVDVTGLPAGTYVLEVEINPERRIEEVSYADNAVSTLVSFGFDG